MTCIKTGCHIYFKPHNSYGRGDAFRVAGAYIFRVVVEDPEPLDSVVHFVVDDWSQWWNGVAHTDKGTSPATVVCYHETVINFGYEGRPL